jgi:parallel beta-helix repeat protein
MRISITKQFKPLAAMLALVTSALLTSTASAQWAINKAGSYKLYANHTVAAGDGIVITASNVTLDLNGFTAATTANATTTAPAPGPTGTRGIVIMGAKNVQISNGHVHGFNINVAVIDSQNVRVDGLQITGNNLAPSGGPTEISFMLLNSYGCDIMNNTCSSTNLGIFVRGPKSTGNRLMKNVISGGAVAANNLLGICYNPAPGGDPAGPRGDSIYNNHIARFGYAIAVSAGTVSNMFTDNTLASFTGAIREPQNFTALGGTNVEFDNTSVTIPTTGL